MRPRRRGRERDRPAARAQKTWQRPLGHLLDHLRVDDLRPPGLSGLRAVQGRLAGTALRRGLRGLRLARIRIPFQAFPRMTGLPDPLAVLPALPLGLLPGPPALLRPDPLLRRRSPRVGAVHPQPALQLSPPLPQFPPGVQLSPQQRVLRVLRLHHGPQPGVRSTKPRSVISQGLTRHAPQAPTAAASRQIDKRRSRPCHGPRLKPRQPPAPTSH